VIVHSVDWAPGGKDVENSFLHVLPNHVIVRHQPRVVDQVEQIVHSIMGPRPESARGGSGGKAKTGQDAGGMGGGGGGRLSGTANAEATAAAAASRPGFF
jgi:hypothetical protein